MHCHDTFARWRHICLVWVLGCLCSALVAAQALPAPAGVPSLDKRVLILLGGEFGGPGVDAYVLQMMQLLKAGGVPRGNIYVEYLSLNQNASPALRQRMASFLREKYAAMPLHVIVVVGRGALDVLSQELGNVGPTAPVYVQSADLPAGMPRGNHPYVVMSANLDYRGTLQRAVELFPDTRNVLVLAGSSEAEVDRLKDMHDDLAPWKESLQIRDTQNMSLDEILVQVAQLPPQSIVMGVGVRRDAKGQVFIPTDTMASVVKKANAPVFVLYDTAVGQGAIGGVVSRLSDDAALMSETMLAHLRADVPLAAHSVVQLPNRFVPLFDWSQIVRWGGAAQALPVNAIFLNRQLSIWDQYRGYVLAASAVIAVLVALVLGLLLQQRQIRRAHGEVKESEARFRVLVDNAPEAIFVFDVEAFRFIEVNPHALALLGYGRDQLLASSPELFLYGGARSEGGTSPDTIQRSIQRALAGELVEAVRTLKTADGRLLQCEVRLVRLPAHRRQLIRASVVDVTDRRQAEARIEQLAYYDVLTGQPNRRLLHERLQRALAACSRSHMHGALLYLDMDNFKSLNESLGHDKGDLLLQEVARRLNGCLRAVDTAARLGGDEFVVLLEDLHTDPHEAGSHAMLVGEKILSILSMPYELAGMDYRSSASIGVAIFGAEDQSADDLLKRADLTMYHAKAAGRNALRFFSPEMQVAVTARVELEADLHRGLQQHQFLMYLQPQVDSHGHVLGAEALLRWLHPQRGMVSPGEFIGLAEETGQIVAVGGWILEAACRQLVLWSSQRDHAHLTLAVNVSMRQFRQPDFVAHVLATLQRTGADPHRLKLELTESLLVDDVSNTIGKMAALKAHGVCFSLDDFGTGYSSLSYLKRLPLDQLKIDQSFVRDVLGDANDAAIARTVIALAETLGLAVIAEGVETAGQRDFLAQHGCHAFQGYLFSKPLSVDLFAKFLAQSPRPARVG